MSGNGGSLGAAVSNNDGDEAFGGVSLLICGFNSEGVDSGDGEGTSDASGPGVSSESVGEVQESEDSGSDGVL